MQALRSIGHPSALTCPDCGGGLFELDSGGGPVRFLCHTGHAFSLRRLASAQAEVTDEMLWSAVRALQEKEAILRRLASTRPGDEAGADLAEADALHDLVGKLRSLVATAPADSTDLQDPA